MLSTILCVSFISAISAAPASKFFNFLPHYGNQMPSGPSAQGTNDYLPLLPLPPQLQQGGINAPISMEILFPPRFPGTQVGGKGPSFPTQAFIKYSLPKAPGQKSVEIYYPYEFMQREVRPNMMPQIPNLFPFGYPPQSGPQQQPPMQEALPQANDPQQQSQIQQDPQLPAGQP